MTYIHKIKMIKGLPIITSKEIIYGDNGITIYDHVVSSIYIPYTSILCIETTDK